MKAEGVDHEDPVAHASHPLFHTDYTSGSVPLRQVLGSLLDRFLSEPLIRAPGAPGGGAVGVVVEGDYATVCVPRIEGRALVVFEE